MKSEREVKAGLRDDLGDQLVYCLRNNYTFGGGKMRWHKACETGAYPKRSVPVSHNAVPAYFAPSLGDAAGCMRGCVPGEGPRPLRVLAPRLRRAPHATRSAKCIVISETVH